MYCLAVGFLHWRLIKHVFVRGFFVSSLALPLGRKVPLATFAISAYIQSLICDVLPCLGLLEQLVAFSSAYEHGLCINHIDLFQFLFICVFSRHHSHWSLVFYDGLESSWLRKCILFYCCIKLPFHRLFLTGELCFRQWLDQSLLLCVDKIKQDFWGGGDDPFFSFWLECDIVLCSWFTAVSVAEIFLTFRIVHSWYFRLSIY